MKRIGLKEKPPVIELQTMDDPPHGRCSGCGDGLEAGQEYLYDHGFLVCEGCLDVDYPEMVDDSNE
jgi:hypothetical protein